MSEIYHFSSAISGWQYIIIFLILQWTNPTRSRFGFTLFSLNNLTLPKMLLIFYCFCLSCLFLPKSVLICLLYVCFCRPKKQFCGRFTILVLGIVVEITGAHSRVWLLLGEHSVCCDSSEALQNGQSDLDQQNVPLLLLYGLCFWLCRDILPVQTVQRKVL